MGILLASHIDGSTEPGKRVERGTSPEDQDLLAWSFDGAAVLGSTALATAGVINGARMFIPDDITVTNIVAAIATAGATLTANQCFAGIWDNAAGTGLRITGNMSTTWNSTGVKTMALASTLDIAGGTYVDVGFWFNGTTGPAFHRGGALGAVNAGTSGTSSHIRFWTANTGVTTTQPTRGTKTANSVAWWIGLS